MPHRESARGSSTDSTGSSSTCRSTSWTPTGTDRETVLTAVAPQAMGLTTGRLADPQEVADVVALLASPRSASTTGADFVVDGGMLKEI